MRRVNPSNCELLVRPKVAISEIASTIHQNFKFLSSDESGYIDSEKFDSIKTEMSSFVSVLEKLDTTFGSENATSQDVKSFLRSVLAINDDHEEFFKTITKLGAAMYSMGIQCRVAQSLLSNPDWLARNSVGPSPELQAFKADPTIGGMKKYLTSACSSSSSSSAACTTSKSQSSKRKLAQLLDSESECNEEDEVPTPPPKKTKKSKKQKKQ